MYIFGWVIGVVLMSLPIILSLISVFMMLTQKAVEPDIFEEGTWGQDIDEMSKKRYFSDF